MDRKIRATRYNERYKEILVTGVLKYLRDQGVKGSQKRIARWRYGMVMREKGTNIGKLKEKKMSNM